MRMQRKFWNKISCGFVAIITLVSCSEETVTIQNGDLKMQVNAKLHTLITSQKSGTKPLQSDFQASEYLELPNGGLVDFEMNSSDEERITGEAGEGTRYTLTGKNEEAGIAKQLTLTVYDSFPDFMTTQVIYINESDRDLPVKAWANNAYSLQSQQDEPPFWAFQGSSSGARADWIKPVKAGYYQKNYMGMNNSDYGGGIPVTDIWRPDVGIAVGHVELSPKLISLPTEMKKHEDNLQIEVREDFEYPTYLKAGDTLRTLETFVSIHNGDYYNGLQNYTRFMQARGIQMPPAEPAAFEPIWCAWGYERNFTLDEVIGTLPKVKELGIKWAVLDDGFQQAEGDWHTNEDKFPGGDQQMKAFVETIHEHGLKAKLWWAPLAADPTSQLLKENPKMRLYLEDWAPQYITWWDAYYLSPSHPKTKAHTKEVVNLFMRDWGYEGLKMDGQHMNAIAPDHNPESGFEDPVAAVAHFPEFFRLIYDEARKINPNAVVENCPCGTCMSYFNMPYMNQAVSSDPLSSWQVRLKGKTYKALIPNTAYYGDHVELSDGGDDFASSFGIGAVLGTKFTWPKNNPTGGDFLLTAEKEIVWKKWFSLYNKKMLSKEPYLGHLYDIGYDKPEAHVVQKADTLHYAFYATNWDGTIELRGLEAELVYEVRDYFNDKVLKQVTAENPVIDVKFEKFLLLEVYPKAR